jgi:hypothetical protein
MKANNPATSLRQLEHIEGQDSYPYLARLSSWKQSHELKHIVSDMDDIVVYCIDEDHGSRASGYKGFQQAL